MCASLRRPCAESSGLSHEARSWQRTGPVFKSSYAFPIGPHLLTPSSNSQCNLPQEHRDWPKHKVWEEKSSTEADTKHNAVNQTPPACYLQVAEITRITLWAEGLEEHCPLVPLHAMSGTPMKVSPSVIIERAYSLTWLNEWINEWREREREKERERERRKGKGGEGGRKKEWKKEN